MPGCAICPVRLQEGRVEFRPDGGAQLLARVMNCIRVNDGQPVRNQRLAGQQDRFALERRIQRIGSQRRADRLHVGLVYAWRYPLEQLRQMVVFFESPAGEAFLKDRGPAAVPDDVAEALRSPELDEDLLDIVCNRPPSDKTLGPHHDWRRLHPGVEGFYPTPAPAWCASTATLTTK